MTGFSIRGTTRVVAVIGDPISHSRSPQLLSTAFAVAGIDAVMVPLAVPSESLRQVVPALAAAGLLGASVTSPHKLSVQACCTTLTPRAERAGAVNCLRFDGQHAIIGDNTDGAGLLADLVAGGPSVADKTVVVLGAGGAARAIETALADAGARTVVVARRPAAVSWLPTAQVRPWNNSGLADAFAHAAVVIDATDTALSGQDDELVAGLPLELLPADAVVVSLVYHRRPALLVAAAARGLHVVSGRGMLVHQAALAFHGWTGKAAPLAAMFAAFDAA